MVYVSGYDGAAADAGTDASARYRCLRQEHIHVEFHETGRAAACFWLDVHRDNTAAGRSPEERMETLVVSLQPVIQALEGDWRHQRELIWSNTGYLIAGI